MSGYIKTKHAEQRLQQRSIPDRVVHILLELGDFKAVPGGLLSMQLTNRARHKLISDAKRLIQLIEKTKNKTIIISTDNHIITGYHETKFTKNRG